jgi:hypothetical protein
MPEGVDLAWGRPGVAALKAAKVTFVMRYLSHDTTGKNLSRSEAQQYTDAGMSVGVVWETVADRALAGYATGAQDARDALAQATACGMPSGRPIYFAVDFDASPAQKNAIIQYFKGVNSVLGVSRTGAYGGYYPIKWLFDAALIGYGWQTYAWSGGKWDSRAQLQQYSNDHTIGGVGLDYDRSTKSDFGQWKVGISPAPVPASIEDDDMPTGMLLNGSKAVTPVSVKRGAYNHIGFMADDGLQGLPIAVCRVAVHDVNGWHVTNDVKISSTIGQTIINFPDPATTNGISIQRSDAGTVNIAWEVS